MANLYYLDEDMVTVKTVANIDSPAFTGNPNTVSIANHADRDIMNVQDVINYVDNAVGGFNESRVISGNGYELSGLEKNKKYMISVYGKFNPGTSSDTYNIGPVAIRTSGNVLLKTSGGVVKNMTNPKCMIPQNAILILEKAPEDGKVRGVVNYKPDTNTGTNASYMMAIRLS